MSVLLVRHAVAMERKDWHDDDQFRPLTERGQRQATGLVELLTPMGVGRVLSSPFTRCLQTVEPLAGAAGVAVEPCDALAEGEEGRALDLVLGLTGAGHAVVLCTHGDVLPWVLDALARRGLHLDEDLPCAKGSTWVLHDDGTRFVGAEYLRPPH